MKKQRNIMVNGKLPLEFKNKFFKALQEKGSIYGACKLLDIPAGSVVNWCKKDKDFERELNELYPKEKRQNNKVQTFLSQDIELKREDKAKFLYNLRMTGNKAVSARLAGLNWGWLKQKIQADDELQRLVQDALDEYAGSLYTIADKRARESSDRLLMMLIKGLFPEFRENTRSSVDINMGMNINIGALAGMSEEELEQIVVGSNYNITDIEEDEIE